MYSSVITSTLPAGRNVDVAATQRLFDRRDLIAFHRGLQRVNRIDLSYHDARPLPRNDCAQPLPTSP